MGLDGEDRMTALCFEKFKQVGEGKFSFPYGQMGIDIAVVVMEMDMAEIGIEGFQPFRQGFPGKDLEVTGIEAEPALGRIQGRQQAVHWSSDET